MAFAVVFVLYVSLIYLFAAVVEIVVRKNKKIEEIVLGFVDRVFDIKS